MSTKEKIDRYLGKWASRKLTVFVVDSSDWVIVATAYIAIEGATNIVERLMKAKETKI